MENLYLFSVEAFWVSRPEFLVNINPTMVNVNHLFGNLNKIRWIRKSMSIPIAKFFTKSFLLSIIGISWTNSCRNSIELNKFSFFVDLTQASLNEPSFESSKSSLTFSQKKCQSCFDNCDNRECNKIQNPSY